MGVATCTILVLMLELGDKMVDEVVVEVLAIQVHVFDGLNLKYPFLDDKERCVKGAATEVEGEDIVHLATDGLLIKVIGDGDGSGLIDYVDSIEVSNEANILGGPMPGVVEVG